MSKKKRFVSLRMSEALYAWLKEKADKAHHSVSWVIRKYLDERKDLERDILN